LGDQLSAIAAAEDSEEARDRFLAVAAASVAEVEEGSSTPTPTGHPSCSSSYYISKSWLL